MRYAMLLPTAAALFGCASPVPVAENFPVSYQKVARTAHHWDVVADDVVTQTLETIAEKPQLQNRGVYVPEGNTAFSAAFRDFLITRFVDRGANVSVCKIAPTGKPGFALDAPDIEILYETRVIGHGQSFPSYRPGALTALASGVAVIRNITESTLNRGAENAGMIGLAAIADVGVGHLALPTRTELIVTTTIAEGNRFIMRRSDVYYVPDGDARLFFQRVAQQSPCAGVAPKTAAATGTDQIEQDLAREDMVMRNMKRSNPDWRGPSSYTAFSY